MDVARPGSSPFARVGRREFGYNTRQVDRFLTKARAHYNAEDPDGDAITSRDVRATAFDPAKGGYEPQAVDAALDRLEDVFAQRERDHLISTKGEDAWLREIGRTAAVLRNRLHRPPGERFRRPTKRNSPSYDIEDVDRLCDQLLQYLEDDLPMSVDVVRRAVFREARGADGYEENQVDGFLDRVVELMAGID
ncbi:DivIVA domain-containing protein [Arthrobacter sp. NamB2]|uniref:DivIVA domain-containing protein n=1 Tax=Arthrobacter sp. NamB2 TaxID=2576035 RepID=UPI0010C9D713|nr:DivIVA domain-containing protein [Arthrobacter sp. NamB2]TKV27916.1 DivIVA domain-containing protein [Arthrobacter sp. NamB2]